MVKLVHIVNFFSCLFLQSIYSHCNNDVMLTAVSDIVTRVPDGNAAYCSFENGLVCHSVDNFLPLVSPEAQMRSTSREVM